MLLLASACLGGGASRAGAAGKKADEGFLLRYKAVKGEVCVYRMTMTTLTSVAVDDSTPAENVIETEMIIVQKTLEAKKDRLVFASRIDSGTMTINGMSQPLPMAGRNIVTTMKPNGEIVEQTGIQNTLQNLQLTFPEHPVRKGSSWRKLIAPTPQVPAELEVRYTILGKEKVGKEECVRIRSRVRTLKPTSPDMKVDVKAAGTIWFSLDKGRLVRNETVTTAKVAVEQKTKGGKSRVVSEMQMKMKLELQ